MRLFVERPIAVGLADPKLFYGGRQVEEAFGT
jgi:hypothetical protein